MKKTHYLLFLLGLLIFLSMFIETLYFKESLSEEITKVTGFEAVFGKSEEYRILGVTTLVTFLKFNLLALLAYLLPLIGGLLSVVYVRDFRKFKYALCTLLFLIGSILLFTLPNYVTFLTDIVALRLGIFGIISGSLSAIGAIISSYYIGKY